MRKKVVYIEPADYIPKKLRKEYHLGGYAELDKVEDKEEYIADCGGIKPIIHPPIFGEDKEDK